MGQTRKEKFQETLPEVGNCVAVEEPEYQSVSRKDSKKKYKCTEPGCNSVFLRPSRLARHLRCHTGERPFKCDYTSCEKTYTNSSHLKRHYETHSLTKQTYKCTLCSLIISNRYNLKRHYKRVHEQINEFCCKTCNTSFKREYHLKEHEAVHAGSALYKCNQCNIQFTTLSIFNKHLRSDREKKSYACTVSECGEVFDKWSLLCEHKRNKHITYYKCKDCSNVFLAKRILKMHSAVHSNDRSVVVCPYENCPRFYFYKNNLDHHIRICHMGEKFQCDICGRKISTKQKLAEHIQRIHQSKRKKRMPKKTEQKKRKDFGISKKSMLSRLTGLDVPPKVEKYLLQRRTRITLDKEPSVTLESGSCDADEILRNVEVDLRTILHCDIATSEGNVSEIDTNPTADKNVSAHL